MSAPLSTVDDAFAATVARRRTRTAVVQRDRRLSFAALDREVRTLAEKFRSAGLQPGQRVLVALPNSVEYVVAFFGILAAGAVVCPTDPRLTRREYERLVQIVDPAVIVGRAPAGPSRFIDALVLESLAGELPSRPSVLTVALGGASSRAVTTPDRCARGRDRVRAKGSDPAAIFFTSGTDGDPLAVVHSHETLLACVESLRATRRGYFSLRPRSVARIAALVRRYRGRLLAPALDRNVWLTGLTFSSISGHTIMLQAVLNGQTLVAAEHFDPHAVLRHVERERVTYLALNPTMGELCLRAHSLRGYDVSSLFVVGLGGSSASHTLAQRVKEQFGCAVALGYGSTELGGGVLASSALDSDTTQVSTVGRPFPGTEVRVVDAQNRIVEPHTVGELVVRSGGLMLGYETSDGRSRHVDRDGWFHTGDLAVLDAQGYVRIVGRKSDLIIRAGQNVYPIEVEEVLGEHPAIDQVACVGVPDGIAGEKIWAFVTLRRGATADAREITRFCRGRLSPLKTPDRIEIVGELPVAGDGKVRKQELRRRALLDVTRSPAPVRPAGAP